MILLRHPLCAAFLAVVTAGGLWALGSIRLETELLPILPPSAPSVRGLSDFAHSAAGEDEIYAVIDPAVTMAERGELATRARSALAAVPGVARVSAPGEIAERYGGTLGAWMLLQAPPEVFSRATAVFAPDAAAERLKKIPAMLSGAIEPEAVVRLQLDPLGVLDSIGGDNTGTTAEGTGFLVVTPDHPLENTAADTAMTDALRGALDKALGPDDRGKVLLTGNPVFNAEISRQMRGDMLVMVAAAIVLLVAAFYAFYRTLRPLGWILFFQTLSMLCGIIVARILYGELNVISMGFASILLGVGMDYSVLVYHYCASAHRQDVKVWRTLRRGIWFSAAVTASSFFMLGLSSFPALRQLAVLVGVGLMATALMATWLLRVVLESDPPAAPRVLATASTGAASWVLRHKGLLAGLAGAFIIILFLLRPWDRGPAFYQSNLESLRPVGSDAYRAQEWLARLDPSSDDAIYVVRGATHDAIRAAAGPLTQVVSPGQESNAAWMVPSETNAAANLAAWPAETSAHLKAAFAQAGIVEEWSEHTLQMAGALDAAKEGRDGAFRAIDPVLRALAGSDQEGKFAFLRVPGAAAHPVPAGGFRTAAPDVEVLPVSWVSLTNELTALAQRDFKYLGLAMLVSIVVLCALAHRSIRMVFLNLAALLVALAIFAGFLAVTGLALTPLSLVSIPLLVGLVVDYSLHILMALENNEGDLHKTYRHLAAPVLLTGLSACIGFGAPALTGQPALRNFGLVMDFGIIAAVAACLMFLPPLYLLGSPKDYRQRGFYRALYRRRSFEWILFGWRLLGRGGAWLISRTIGLGYALTHPSTVRVVRRNMAMLDPRRAGFVRACRLFTNQAENFSAYGRLAREETRAVLGLIGETRGFEHLERAKSEGKGCMLVTGHLGFFELGGLVLAQMGFPMTALTLPEPGSGLTEWRADFRARWGVRTIVIGNESFAVLDAVRALQAGSFVASLADRPYDGNGLDIPLPHGRMKFATGPVLLALLADCPIVPVAILREPRGTYLMDARGYIKPGWLPEGREATLRHYTEMVAASLVPVFEQWSDQWFQFSPVDAAPIAREAPDV
jgi:predicted RND superfamily exporter protein/lauroyl/myristoyl acyltransferase